MVRTLVNHTQINPTHRNPNHIQPNAEPAANPPIKTVHIRGVDRMITYVCPTAVTPSNFRSWRREDHAFSAGNRQNILSVYTPKCGIWASFLSYKHMQQWAAAKRCRDVGTDFLRLCICFGGFCGVRPMESGTYVVQRAYMTPYARIVCQRLLRHRRLAFPGSVLATALCTAM
jgi:hypothetical protein